jgi:UDP-N-acetylmuramoyl-tripeptide--D-alanyl-D-alanine ligase
MEVIERPDGVTVINDAYNASPESTRAALKSLGRVATGRRSWAVLGEMRELGDDSEPEHEAVGELVGELGINRLVVVGEAARGIRRGAMDQGVASERAWLVPDPAAAAELLHDQVEAGDVVLVKASRAVGLEVVADSLLRDWPQAGDAQ